MTPDDLAALHQRCFETPRPWSASEFVALLGMTGVFLCETPTGFALGRAIAGEAELLTLAVAPEARRRGQGRSLLESFETAAAHRGATSAFLEVSAANTAAAALYAASGYQRKGRRPGYYRAPDGTRIDALLFAKPLTSG